MDHQDIEAVIENYKKAVAEDEHNFHAHHHLGMYYAQCHQYQKAAAHFTAALKAKPCFLLAHYHLGLLYFQQQDYALAKLRFLSVLDLDGQHLPAHFYTGVIALQAEELDQAEQHFHYVLMLDAHHVQTLINLGALSLKRDAGQTAIAYFTQALVLDQNNIEARQNIAATFLYYDRYENALTHYIELQKNHALDTEDLYNMGVALMALGQLFEAAQAYQQVLQQVPEHVAALNNLAAIYIRQGDRFAAIPLLQQAIKINPSDASSQFMLNVLEKKQPQPKESQVYIKNLFNNYSLNYDQHMQRTLQYALPQRCDEVLQMLPVEKFEHALDLGCGTGLSGVILRDYCDKLTGVDLSAKMLAQARKKGCYDQLLEMDILSFLQKTVHTYDFIQLLDVLPYFGELKTLFTLIVPHLNPCGLFVLSAEISHDDAWKIQDSMRFCHSVAYIDDLLLASGLQQVHRLQTIARQENEQNLYETILVYKKGANSAFN